MSDEAGQLDISDRLTMVSNAQPKPSEWTDIGEAEVVYTVFGKAKVRIVRKQDKIRRLFFLLAITLVLVALWQGWELFQKYAPISLFNLSSNTNLSFSVPIPEKIPATEFSLPAKSKEKSISEKVPNSREVDLNNPTQPQTNFSSGKIIVKPVLLQPLNTFKPQSAPLAASNVAPVNQVNKILPPVQAPKPLAQKASSLSDVEQNYSGNLPGAAHLDSPLNNENAAPAATGENQLVDPAGTKQ
jgi:hypothetical protein